MARTKILKNKKFRILCIDGGGLKGVFTIYALMQLKKEYGIDVYEEFDMFVGTSTGALILALILSKKNLEDAYNEYIRKPNFIFSEKNSLLKQLRSTFFSQFKSENLVKNIEQYVDDMSFEEFEKIAKKPFLFTATNITEAKPVVFGSSHFNFVNQRYRNTKIRDALYASSAAPFYFEPLIEKGTDNIIADGGLWANNPVLLAIIYAIGDLEVNFDNIEIVSFGQTNTEKLAVNFTKGFTPKEIFMLISSSLVARQNFDNFASTILLKDRLFRYSPEEEFKGNKLSNISDEFINYTHIYWEENKENLLKFIKKRKRKNLNYFLGKEKQYN
ncbi:MAG: patatin [Candidatus Hepatoplasma vulgare]|nr:MAG: patatin [Candidatus Hepatoplasma sp.]